MRRAISGVSLVAVSLAFAACGGAPAQETAPVAAPEAPAAVQVSLAEVGLDAGALDRSVDPCNDFYQFACGGWIAKTEIPGDEASWYRSFNEIDKRNEAALREILDEVAKDPASKLGTYYAACMDEESVETAGLAPIADLLKEIKALKDVKQIPALLGKLHRRGIKPLFRLSAEQDFGDATRVIASFDQGGIGMPDRDDYLNNDERAVALRAAYHKHVLAMLELAGWKPKDAATATDDVVKFETELAKVSKTRVERRDPKGLYNKMTRQELVKSGAHMDWNAYFLPLDVSPTDVNLTSLHFFAGMDALMGATKLPAWKNYLAWHVLRATADVLPKKFVDEAFNFKKAVTGQAEQKPRWRRCVQDTDESLGELLGQHFVALHFAGDSKKAAIELVGAIRDAFADNLKTLVWMDTVTREKALNKQQEMAFLIGFPSKWRVYTFEPHAKEYGKNALAASMFAVAFDLARIGKPLDRELWQMSPPTVNAYYDPQRNHMVFPAGILQPPFFDAKFSPAVNLGGIGMVIGHELTHGFDDEGAQFDAQGNLKNWWSPEVETLFKGRTECVAKQYSGFEVQSKLFVNGDLTNGENIADMGGLKMALAALRKVREKQKEVRIADGFSEEQQLFMANAQAWCGKMRPEMEQTMVKTNPHSPAKFRVNGPMANLPEFAAAFQCKAGTPMNPANRCGVW
jgi:putative endopeptidase